jgi:predicted nucleotidyltransferase
VLPAAVRSVVSEDKASQIRQLGERLGVRNIRVFGSLTRGDHRPDSDLDLLVDYVPGHGGFAFVEFCERVEELLQREVDVVTERSLHPILKERVLAEALPL